MSGAGLPRLPSSASVSAVTMCSGEKQSNSSRRPELLISRLSRREPVAICEISNDGDGDIPPWGRRARADA